MTVMTQPGDATAAHAGAVSEAKLAIGAWFACYNRRDLPAMRQLMHVPFVEMRGSRINVIEERNQYDPGFPSDSAGREVYVSPVAVRVCQHSADDVVFEIESNHILADRRPIGSFSGLYFMVKKNGRWGLRAISLHDGATDGTL